MTSANWRIPGTDDISAKIYAKPKRGKKRTLSSAVGEGRSACGPSRPPTKPGGRRPPQTSACAGGAVARLVRGRRSATEASPTRSYAYTGRRKMCSLTCA